ncbi:MAG: carboxypeptidase-like regulatory domain-containing protein [Bacteroidota bacterium]
MIVLALSSSLLIAQKGSEIEGVITDAATNEPIAYANVALEGTSNGTITDDKGFYSLKMIKPGDYRVRATYVGYADAAASVSVTAGDVIKLNLSLHITSIQGEEVTITAMARGQAKAINTQIAAKNIKNVVSEQKIRELPDANAAEALSRLPGISVHRAGGEAIGINIRGVGANTLSVNGIRMNGGLASISSSMIGSIEVNKAFMPDQDADVLGGNVEFKMREAKPGFKKDIWVRSGYNSFTGSFKMQDVSVLLSNRFLDDRLGVMLSLNYDRKDRGRDVLNAFYQPIGTFTTGSEDILPVQPANATLTSSHNMNNRFGATLYADYQLKNGKLYYQGFNSLLHSDNYWSSNHYATGPVIYNTDYFHGREQNMLNGLGGEHHLLGAKIDWSASLSNSTYEVPDRFWYGAVNLNATDNLIDIDTTSTLRQFLGLDPGGATIDHDLAMTGAQRMARSEEARHTAEMALKLDVEVPFRVSDKIDGYVKFGGKMRDIGRSVDITRYEAGLPSIDWEKMQYDIVERMPEIDWIYTESGWLSHENFAEEPHVRDFSIDGLDYYYAPDFGFVEEVLDNVDDKLNQNLAWEAGDYTNSERYYAGYLMAGFDIGKMITFTPGVRYENNSYSTTARRVIITDAGGSIEHQGSMKDTTAGHFNAQFFPMMHLKIKPVSWFDIRLAATKTATRPDHAWMSPRYTRHINYNFSSGDVYLTPQINYNYDLYLSFYTRKSGLFTVGAFYKKLTDQLLHYTITIVEPEDYGLAEVYRGKTKTDPVNNEWPGYVRGVEVDWQTHFSFLPKPFNGIILNANMTYMQSRTRYPFYSFETIEIPEPPFRQTVGKDSSRVSEIVGMPKWVGNLALGYEAGGFSGRISAYYQSGTITATQTMNKAYDQSKDALLRLDLQLSQKIRKVPGLCFYLNVNNLTNNADRNILTYHPERIVMEERYGTSGDIGVRYRF